MSNTTSVSDLMQIDTQSGILLRLEQYWGEVGLGPLGSFFGYVCLLGAYIVFLALYASHATGRFGAFLFNFFVGRQHDVRIEIGALRVTLTAIFVDNLQYTTTDGLVKVHKGAISLRWWLRRVRQSERGADAGLPFRVLVDLSGVEVFLYNHREKYSYLEKLQRALREDTLFPTADILRPSPRLKYGLPPGFRFSLSPVVVYVGAPRLPTTLVLAFKRGFGFYFPPGGIARSLASTPSSGSSTVTGVSVIDAFIYLTRNGDFVGNVEVAQMARALSDEDRISQSLDSFNRFLADLKLNLLEVKHVVDDMPGISKLKGPFSRRKQARGGAQHRVRRPRIAATASRQIHLPDPDILCCRLLTLRYAQVGNVDAVLSRDAFGRAYDTLVTYGPLGHRQRLLFVDYFFHADFQDTGIIPAASRLNQSSPRAGAYQFRISFFQFATVRVPYRVAALGMGGIQENTVASNDGSLGGTIGVPRSSRSCAWISVDAGSEVRASIPTVARTMAGSAAHVFCELVRPTIVSSTTHAPAVSAERLSVGTTMRYPVAWNCCHRWSFDIVIHRPDVFLFWQYLRACSDLAADWADCAEVNLAEFIPTLYTYTLACHDTSVFINVNDSNVVSRVNDLLLSEHVALSIPLVNVNIVAPLDEHKAVSQCYDVALTLSSRAVGLETAKPLRTCACAILLPAQHPARRIYNASLTMHNLCLRPRLGPIFLEFERIQAKCTYVYRTTYLCHRISNERRNDTFGISTDVTNLRFVRYRSAMKAMLSVHGNIFGDTTFVTSTAAYAAAGMANTPSQCEARRACIVCQNAFETHITLVVKRCEVLLPTVLYPPLDGDGRIVPYMVSITRGISDQWHPKRRRGEWFTPQQHSSCAHEPPFCGEGKDGAEGKSVPGVPCRDARKPFALSFDCDEVCAEIRSVTNATNAKSDVDVAIASAPVHVYAPQPYVGLHGPGHGLPAAETAASPAVNGLVTRHDGADGCIDGVHWHWHNSFSRARGGIPFAAHAPMVCYNVSEELHLGFIACAMDMARLKRSIEAISHLFVTKHREDEWYAEERAKVVHKTHA